VDHEEPAEVAAVRVEERDVHSLDPAVGLHAPEHRDEGSEHLDGALLATSHRGTEADEQGSICHHDSFLSLDAPNLSERVA
jgi:hypothetical protein